MAVQITAMTCGWLDADLAGFLKGETGRIKVPVPCWLIDHPRGRVLFDTGLHPQLQSDPRGRLGALADAFIPDYQPGEEVRSRLESLGVDPREIRYLVISHLHFDHVGGNAQIPNAQLVIQRREWDAGRDADLIRRNAYNRADYDLGHDLLTIDGEHDLFGDRTVVCIPSWGHTAGHQSLRVRLDSGEVVLTSDACYLRRTLDEMKLPPFAHSREAMLEVLERFRAMEAAGARLFFGHEPAQWKNVRQAPQVIA
jgi:N-acyl homoserine lactone hydrolase